MVSNALFSYQPARLGMLIMAHVFTRPILIWFFRWSFRAGSDGYHARNGDDAQKTDKKFRFHVFTLSYPFQISGADVPLRHVKLQEYSLIWPPACRTSVWAVDS